RAAPTLMSAAPSKSAGTTAWPSARAAAHRAAELRDAEGRVQGSFKRHYDALGHAERVRDMSERRTALVVGATGVVGRNLLRHLAGLRDWEVIALSRRKPDVEGSYVHLP